MRSALIFSAAAVASAVAPPRIELDLSAMSNAYKLASSIERSHDLSYTQADGTTAVMSRQDWTEKCPAGSSTDATTCPFPKAAAYDHQNGYVDVTTRVKLVDLNGVVCNDDVTTVNFAERSTYLFRYDAHDDAGNRAEQVIFALILDDTTAPTISMCGGAAETVEAASAWKLCSTSSANDNIDGARPIDYSIQCVSSSSMLATEASFAVAETVITTMVKGKFLVTLCAHDLAGVYGVNSLNNNYCESKAVNVIDTRPPVINVKGAEPTVHECATTYTDAGYTVTDLLDSATIGDPSVTVVSNVNSAIVANNYEVTYDSSDASSNAATQQTRHVHITDTTAPVVALKGSPALSQVVHYAGATLSDVGASCTDTCDSTINDASIVETWSRTFNNIVLGEYIVTYTCTDASSNTAAAERKFTVIDQTQPEITVMGYQAETYEATRDAEYTDKGASCSDQVDGMISHAIEVSGQVVNMRIPAIYDIRYDCQDLSGNQAPEMTRKVVIEDTQKPCLTLIGAGSVFIEAGFPYTDLGATATDDLDGDITSRITTTGDTVNTVTPDAGPYTIHYHVTDTEGNTECAALCRTVTVQDTLPPVITLHLHKNLIHTSDHSATGVNSVANPAGDAAQNPHLASDFTGGSPAVVANGPWPTSLMAEEAQTSSVNGWVIGAVASAVSGLALLANSRRTQAEVTVPV